VKIYSVLILGITTLLLSAGCNLFEDSYRPGKISAYPSPSESSIQWGGHKGRVRANIVSVDVECVPVKKKDDDTGIFRGKTRTEYEISATAHIDYQIVGKGFIRDTGGSSNLEANLIFEPVTAAGYRLAIVKRRVRLVENAGLTKASVKISGLSNEEIKRVVGLQAKWE